MNLIEQDIKRRKQERKRTIGKSIVDKIKSLGKEYQTYSDKREQSRTEKKRKILKYIEKKKNEREEEKYILRQKNSLNAFRNLRKKAKKRKSNIARPKKDILLSEEFY